MPVVKKDGRTRGQAITRFNELVSESEAKAESDAVATEIPQKRRSGDGGAFQVASRTTFAVKQKESQKKESEASPKRVSPKPGRHKSVKGRKAQGVSGKKKLQQMKEYQVFLKSQHELELTRHKTVKFCFTQRSAQQLREVKKAALETFELQEQALESAKTEALDRAKRLVDATDSLEVVQRRLEQSREECSDLRKLVALLSGQGTSSELADCSEEVLKDLMQRARNAIDIFEHEQRNRGFCLICQDENTSKVLLLPCRHSRTCERCSHVASCPVCHTRIEKRINLSTLDEQEREEATTRRTRMASRLRRVEQRADSGEGSSVNKLSIIAYRDGRLGASRSVSRSSRSLSRSASRSSRSPRPSKH